MDTVDLVFKELPKGRVASWPSAAKNMMRLLAEAPAGNHLEIGVLHGGTLIMSALVKQSMGLNDKVIGLDPLDGYYPPYCMHPNGVKPHPKSERVLTSKIDNASNMPITLEVVEENLRYFGVYERVAIIKDFSIPWPKYLFYASFSSAYIDGDHYNEAPLIDWMNVSQRVVIGGIVWFDDCNDNCPGVQRACAIAEQTPGWEKIGHFENHTFALRRVS